MVLTVILGWEHTLGSAKYHLGPRSHGGRFLSRNVCGAASGPPTATLASVCWDGAPGADFTSLLSALLAVRLTGLPALLCVPHAPDGGACLAQAASSAQSLVTQGCSWGGTY